MSVDYEIVEIDKKHYGHSYSKKISILHIRRKGDRFSVCHNTYMNPTDLSLSEWQLDDNSSVYCECCEMYAKKFIMQAKHIPLVDEEIRESRYDLLKQRLHDIREQFSEDFVGMPSLEPGVNGGSSDTRHELLAELPKSASSVPNILARAKNRVVESLSLKDTDSVKSVGSKIEPNMGEIFKDKSVENVNKEEIKTEGEFSFLNKSFETLPAEVVEDTTPIPNVFRKRSVKID